MLKFEWNALRIGDQVLVHDPGTSEMALLPGVVAVVNAHKGQNGVGIRGSASGENAVLWPARLAVHRALGHQSEPCWRCETLTVGAGPRPDLAAEAPEFGVRHDHDPKRRSA